mgnify:CR=1 FL=1
MLAGAPQTLTVASTSVGVRRGSTGVLAVTLAPRRAAVGRRARLDGAVVFDDAVIDDGAVVERSIIGRGARIGRRALVRDTVIGDNARIGADCELLRGARVWPGIEIPDGGIRFSTDV